MDSYDLSLIASAMSDTRVDGYVDPTSRPVYIGYDGEILDDDGDPLEFVPDDWVRIETASSAESYDDMVRFAEAITERATRERLLTALEGSGAFRRFRDAVHRGDETIGRAWSRFRDAREELRAAEWLRAEEIVTDAEFQALIQEPRHRLDELRDVLAAASNSELAAVEALERELQTPACRADRRRLMALLAVDFEEIGASGRLRDAADILDLLAAEPVDSEPIVVSDLVARHIAEDVILVRWTSARAGQTALRTSLWRREDRDWRLVHHQGTPAL